MLLKVKQCSIAQLLGLGYAQLPLTLTILWVALKVLASKVKMAKLSTTTAKSVKLKSMLWEKS